MHATILLATLLLSLTTTFAYTSTKTSFTDAVTRTTTLPQSSATILGCRPIEGTNSCCDGIWGNATYGIADQSNDSDDKSSSTVTLPTATMSKRAPAETIIATGKEPYLIVEAPHCDGTIYVIETMAPSTTTSLTSSSRTNGVARATGMPEKAWEVLAIAAIAAAGVIV